MSVLEFLKPFSLEFGAVVIFFAERAAEMTWPEASSGTWWWLGAASAVVWVVWVALSHRSDLQNLFRQSRTRTGQVPLIEGVDLAWSHLSDTPVISDVEGKNVFRHLVHQMFDGTKRSVPLYGIRPPLRSRALIGNAHEYRIEENGSAVHRLDDSDRVTDLHVRRADVKRWVRDTLADRRKAGWPWKSQQ